MSAIVQRVLRSRPKLLWRSGFLVCWGISTFVLVLLVISGSNDGPSSTRDAGALLPPSTEKQARPTFSGRHELERDADGNWIVHVLYWRKDTDFFWPPDDEVEMLCKDTMSKFVEVRGDWNSEEDAARMLLLADMVIFNFDFPSHSKDVTVPAKLRNSTVYVLASMESPQFRKAIRSRPFLDNFNYFWSYNTGVFLHTTYLTRMVFKYKHFTAPALVPYKKKASVPLITIFSNCDDAFGRFTLIKRLMRHLSIHNYGTCLNNKAFPPKVDSDELVSRYKFVFAMENSICTDYVSEKWIRALRVGTIPLVVSYNNTPNYDKYSPSLEKPMYINVGDFKTTKDLARRINEIALTEELYSEFLSYRQLQKEKLNPHFRQLINELETKNRGFCRFARYWSKSGKFSLSKASRRREKPLRETCADTEHVFDNFWHQLL